MAPLLASQFDHDVVEKKLKDVIQDLFQIMVQVNTYDQFGRSGRDVLETSFTQLSKTISTLYQTVALSSTSNNSNTTATAQSENRSLQLPEVPPELIQYVDHGRNPDIYTREFVELARKSNQLMNGKIEAFADFRDILASEMCKAMPELEADIALVLQRTGGVDSNRHTEDEGDE